MNVTMNMNKNVILKCHFIQVWRKTNEEEEAEE